MPNQKKYEWLHFVVGPIVGGLVNKYGCRPVCIAGSCNLVKVEINICKFSYKNFKKGKIMWEEEKGTAGGN